MCWFMVEICSNLVRNLREIEILVTKYSGKGKIRIFLNFDAIICKRLVTVLVILPENSNYYLRKYC